MLSSEALSKKSLVAVLRRIRYPKSPLENLRDSRAAVHIESRIDKPVNVRLRGPAQNVFLGQPLDQMVDAARITPTVINVYSLIALHCATLAAYRYRYENMIVSPAERVSKRKSRELAETGRGFKWRAPRGSPREGVGRLSHRLENSAKRQGWQGCCSQGVKEKRFKSGEQWEVLRR